MKTILLATLAMTMFAGCAGLPPASSTARDSSSNLTGPQTARAPTIFERLFKAEAAPQRQSESAPAPAASGADEFLREQAKAQSGDRDAMFRIAQMYRDGCHGLQRDEQKMVSWLRQASEREHKVASYELYLHYVQRGLDRQAVHYEKLALRQGYVVPARVDARRG